MKKINVMNVKSSDLKASIFSERDLFWLVGIYEGEGCVRVPKKKRSELTIQIGMIDKDIVEKIAKLFGNRNIYTRKRKNRKAFYICQVSGAHAVEVLLALIPFLGVRRKERAKEAIDAYDGFQGSSGYKLNNLAALQIREMKSKGKTAKEIALLFRVNEATIYRVLQGIRWSNVE